MAEVVGHAKGMLKAGGAAGLGLLTGAVMMYSRAAVEKVTKSQPLANFSVAEKDGLKVTFHNQATGDSGYWDFGDCSELVPFAADSADVTHTYAKAGSYTAKLTVRNFLMEEKDRGISVDVEASAATAPGLLPKMTLTVDPVGKQVAPATFRVRGEVQNVERAFLDLGDRVEVTDVGPFDKYIVIDKPGSFPIQLIGHTGKQATKQSATVDVKGDRAGGFSAVVRTTDTGTRTIKDSWHETVVVPAVKGQKGFEKVVQARHGFTLTNASLGASNGVKGLTAAIAPDNRSVKLSGEWAKADVAEVIVSLYLNGEKSVPVEFPQTSAVPFDGAQAMVPLPPQRRDMAGVTRKVSVELRVTDAGGKPQVVASTADLKGGKWEQPTSDGRVIRAEQVGEQVRVSIGR